MKFLTFCRGVFVLCLAPVLTALTSLFAIFMAVVCRSSQENIQELPQRLGRIIAWCSGVSVEVSGVEGIEHGKPYIFAANHQSQFDIFVLQGFLGFDFRWLAKKELFKVPVFGYAMRLAGYIPVDRSHGRQALKSLDEAAERIAAGVSVVIFPEGTRSMDGNLLPFKPGAMVLAIKAGVPVVPVAIVGTHQVLPKGKLLARSGRVIIRVGEPIATRGYVLKDKRVLAARIEESVSALKNKSA